MSLNLFINSTPLYKKYMILDYLFSSDEITQREISKYVGIAVSRVNIYLEELEQEGFIERLYHTPTVVDYIVTNKGIKERQKLNVLFLSETQKLYEEALKKINEFLSFLYNKGFKKILLYGAGEVASILLQALDYNGESYIDVIAIIDDDKDKVGSFINSKPIISIEDINKYSHDGILISSYYHHGQMLENLKSFNYPLDKILEYF